MVKLSEDSKMTSFQLTSEQDQALSLIEGGHSIVIQGQAGVGKSVLLQKSCWKLVQLGKKVVKLSSTGYAARHINGQTIHKFFLMKDGRFSRKRLLTFIKSDIQKVNELTQLDCILIDEASMISAKILDDMEYILSQVRAPNVWMGGCQIVLFCDIFQLPPVPNEYIGDDGKRFFESAKFLSSIPHKIILNEVQRQSDQQLINAINEVARGNTTPETDNLMRSLARPLSREQNPKKLYHRHVDVRIENNNQLLQLQGAIKTYESDDIILDAKAEKLVRVPKTLHLKLGAPIRLAKNISSVLTNGLLGKVIELKDDRITVSFEEINHTEELEKAAFSVFSVHLNKPVFVRYQIPVTLAYCQTIHSSQCLTLDSVEVYCDTGPWEPGLVGVAVGRARTRDGLRVINYDPRNLRPHPNIVYEEYMRPGKPFLGTVDCCRSVHKVMPYDDEDFSDDEFLSLVEIIESAEGDWEAYGGGTGSGSRDVTHYDSSDDAKKGPIALTPSTTCTEAPERSIDKAVSESIADTTSVSTESVAMLMTIPPSGSSEECSKDAPLEAMAPGAGAFPASMGSSPTIHDLPENVAEILLSILHEGDNVNLKEKTENSVILKLMQSDEFLQFVEKEWIFLINSANQGFKQATVKSGKVNFHKGQSYYHTAFYQHIASDEYRSNCSPFLHYGPTDSVMSVMGYFMLKLRAEALKYVNVGKNRKEGDVLHAEDPKIPQSAYGKLRYIFGRCIAKEIYYHQRIINYHKDSLSAKILTFPSRMRIDILKTHKCDQDTLVNKSKYKDSLEETVRRQNIQQSLTHISDDMFEWFIEVEKERQLAHRRLKNETENILPRVKERILKNDKLFIKWVELFRINTSQFNYIPSEQDDEQDPVQSMLYVCTLVSEAIADLYGNIINRFTKVGGAQYMKTFVRESNIKKGIAHRHNVLHLPGVAPSVTPKGIEATQVPEVTPQQISVTHVPAVHVSKQVDFKTICTDSSRGKSHSHQCLKRLSPEEIKSSFKKGELITLCKAYCVKYQSKDNKGQLAGKLVNEISVNDLMPVPEAFPHYEHGTVPTETHEHVTVPVETEDVWICPFCMSEIHDDSDESIQCSTCVRWIHRICAGLVNADVWAHVQQDDVEWTCNKCQ